MTQTILDQFLLKTAIDFKSFAMKIEMLSNVFLRNRTADIIVCE